MDTLPLYGELLSFCSFQAFHQRCEPLSFANELVSKLSRTLAAALVMTVALAEICLMPAVRNTCAC